MVNYFTLLSMPQEFVIELAELERHYFAAQRQFHPDRLVGKSPQERREAIAQSMLANEAYDVLKNPLTRARHLLALQGIAHGEAKPSQELLMEIMEAREALAEAETMQSIEKLSRENEKAKQQVLEALSHAFEHADTAKAAESAMRLSYLLKFEDEIRIRRKALAA